MVEDAHDEWQSTSASGECHEVNFGNLETGTHRVRIKYVDVLGYVNYASKDITVVRRGSIGNSGNKKVIYIHTDILGTPVAESDENGDIVQ